ncbi:uncharacterized protein LOC129942350 [Eupeodes corollae]|uniref:uncharacterized protein LOC129942350 n=1 Tax=Eupeodes corollae TaxID=290404 RepID=UPI0024923353|nr:uncharacterized protein LOC129942350 [Eupeodes corollae]
MLEEELFEMAETATMVYLAWCVLESISDDDDDRGKPRSTWQKKWLNRREREGFCAKLLMELREEEPELYRNVMRMSSKQFDYLLNLVKPHFAIADTKLRQSISAEARLALTLRYLATGESFNSLRLLFRIALPTISAIIPEVLDAINKILVGDFFKKPFPKNEVEWEAVAKQFWDKWQFPHCIGAVDGKHVVINAPPNAGSIYYNYKGTHSIVLMGIADAEYKFLYVDVGRNGRFSDGGVFTRCSFSQDLNRNDTSPAQISTYGS